MMRRSRKGQTMPKEQINTPARRTVTESRPGNGVPDGVTAFGWAEPGDQLHDGQRWEDTPVVFLAWDPRSSGSLEPSAVLHIEVDCDEVLRAAATINQLRERDDVGHPERWMFHTVALARGELQKLIRTTRRARDAVYGEDE